LPLTFEANRGQTDGRVKFLSHGHGYTAFLTAGGMVLSLRPSEVRLAASSTSSQVKQTKSATLQFNLVGAAPSPAAVGEEPQPGRVNYFLGKDKTKWRTNVATYAKVRYKNVYSGIDLLYYGNNRQLEYDFAVAPGADPNVIQFDVKGASQIVVSPAGDLVLKIGTSEVHFQCPTIYQESQGARVPVRGQYILKSPTRIGFQVANFDSSKALVIDPVLVYSTYLGGSGDDNPAGIAVDGNGNAYVAGYTDSTDFPLATPVPNSQPAPSLPHVFVAKLDPTGSNAIYTDIIGGSGEDYGYAVAVNSAGEVYVTGSTASSDFPTVNAYQASYPGAFNAFLTRISADGSSLLYSTYLGGNGSDTPASVVLDKASNVLVAGTTSSTDFPLANAYQSSAPPNQGGQYGTYGFVTEFTPDGSSLVYSTYFGGSSNVALNCGGTPCWPQPTTTLVGAAFDSTGSVFVTGTTNTYDFPVTSGVYQSTNTMAQDGIVGFLSKISNSGTLQYSTYFYDPASFTNITALAVDASDSAYVTGWANSDSTFPVTSAGICDPATLGSGCSYTFVTKFDTTASTLAYSTFLGANNGSIPAAIVVDQSSNTYVLGTTSSSTFTTVNELYPYAGGYDALLVEIDPIASSQLFATYLGGTNNETATAMALDAGGNLYVTGSTLSTDFPTTPAAVQKQAGGNNDGFVVKIATITAPVAVLTPSSVTFAAQQVGSTSSIQQVVLQNTGNAALSISSISVAGDFSETNNCGNSLPPSGTCSVSIAFSPTASGQRTGSLVVSDDAAGAPHVVGLSGTGLADIAALTPGSLTFVSLPIGISSTAQTVSLLNQGNVTVHIGNIQVTGDFAQTNNCSSSLPAGSSCTVSVTFMPTASGSRTGTLTISDDAAGSPQTATLTGTGADFNLSSAATSATVKAGATATYTLTVSPIAGAFTQPIKLSCAGAPAQSTCSLSTSSVTPGSSAATVTLTIATAGSSASAMSPFPASRHLIYAACMQLQGFGLLGVFVGVSKRWRKRAVTLLLLGLIFSVMLLMPGCIGSTGIVPTGGTGTSPGTYTITVSGASGALQHSLPLSLIVQ
jgi:hypothetical protein